HAEGYVKHTAGAFNYVFNYTDHLGNVRMSYGKDPVSGVLKITEENNYYAFGMKHKNYNMSLRGYGKLNGSISLNTCENCVSSYKYKYQGQERQDELGLNWDSFKWRNYDYAIGRFMSIDPLAEDYIYNSPYAFAENKIGMGRELEGCELGPLWGPMAGVMLETTNTPPLTGTMTNIAKTSIEVGAKTSETVGGKTEIHHLIPRGVKGNDVVKAARDEGFKFEGAENKVPLEKFSKVTGEGQHGNHPNYNKGVLEKITEFAKANEGATPKDALNFIRNLTNELKQTIKNNPDTKVNDILKTKTAIDNTAVRKPDLPKPDPKPKPDPNSK
ncbi:hypothetical protein B0A58_16140, partial [Flavobacterium branchiophilum NBRC 15030 = ATCC 35035]